MTKTTTTKTFYAAIDESATKMYDAVAWEIHVEHWRHVELAKLQLKLRALARLADSSSYSTHITRILFESYITLHGNFDELRELPELPNMRVRRSVEGFPQYAVKCTDHRIVIQLFRDAIESEQAKTNRAIRNIDNAYPAYRTITGVEAEVDEIVVDSSGNPTEAKMNYLIAEMLNKLKKEAAKTPDGKAELMDALCRQSPAELLRKICVTDANTKPATTDDEEDPYL